jgi:hypothetical protein
MPVITPNSPLASAPDAILLVMSFGGEAPAMAIRPLRAGSPERPASERLLGQDAVMNGDVAEVQCPACFRRQDRHRLRGDRRAADLGAEPG